MKVLPFTIPVPDDRTIILQEEVLPHFYPYLHRHAEVQITWIQQGEGTLLAGNSMHAFTAGEIYVLGANLPHLFKSSPEYFEGNSELGIRALTVFFDPIGKLSALFKLPEMKGVQACFEKWKNGFKIPDNNYLQFSEYMDEMQHAGGAVQLSLFIDMLNAMSGIGDVQALSPGNYSYSMTDPEGMRIASVYNYIMHNYGNALTLEEVARQAHLTPNAFCRYFKKHTRLTFIAFVNKVRVNQACKLLVSGNLNQISAVAYSCGFSSITNFNYVFKNITGQSPRDYVNNYSEALKSGK